MRENWRRTLPWALTALVSGLAIYVWGQSFAWQWNLLTAYLFFPVLGLLAWSIMWSHYVVSAVRNNALRDVPLENYFRYTGYIVLAAIVLHPGILVYQLFRDGRGLPPSSYEHYVAPGLGWITLLGTASLLAFLAFELHRWYRDRAWWRYVVTVGDVAMVAIFYHGLRLGTQLQSGWFRVTWWFYGLTLLAILARKYVRLLQTKRSPEADQ